jgi:class 3 adenylate cyclase
VDVPETRFARSGDVHIAYKIIGEGPIDLVFVAGMEYQTVEALEFPPLMAEARDFPVRAGPLMRLIRFDKRGTGSSDRVVGVPSLEERMDDVRAVMDAAGSEGAVLFGQVDGAAMSLLFAATYPDRTVGLVLWKARPRFVRAPDFSWAPTREEYERQTADELESWLSRGSIEVVRERAETVLGARANDEVVRRMALVTRLTVSPGAYVALRRMNMDVDVRQVLPAIHVPTLLLHGAIDRFSAIDPTGTEVARYMAERMPNARTLEVAREANELTELVSPPVVEFLERAWKQWTSRAVEPQRVLATVLFTDIVGATDMAVELGPRWPQVLAEHNAIVRRELSRFNGREVDTAGDGFFASGFDGPARAIRCACAIRDGITDLGLQVRVGVHTGECDIVDGKLSGLAVNIGARVAAQANEGEVLVSGTVKDLVAGSGIVFDSRGERELNGVGEWTLYAVRRTGPTAPVEL